MSIYHFFLLAFLFVSVTPLFSQPQNSEIEKVLSAQLESFYNCRGGSDDLSKCNEIISESLQKAYNINDFNSGESGGYMSFNEILAYVKSSDQWQSIGPGYEQASLKQAQDVANSKKAVIAIYEGSENGHIAFVLPGELQTSGSWGMSVPNSASFFTAKPEKSFVGKSLSYAFTTSMIKDLTLYKRK
ncbi:MAG: hypothetical protein AAF363_05760 [Bacteroidota bacterium]